MVLHNHNGTWGKQCSRTRTKGLCLTAWRTVRSPTCTHCCGLCPALTRALLSRIYWPVFLFRLANRLASSALYVPLRSGRDSTLLSSPL